MMLNNEENLDKLYAFDVLKRFVIASGDEEAIAALAALVGQPAPSPPRGLGAAVGEANALAQQLTKTGLVMDWATPPRHSLAMERLVHRLTCLLEVMIDLLQEETSEKTR